MRMLTVALLFVSASLLAGCPTESSNDIATDALYVAYRITEVGDVVLVRAEFRVGNPLGTLLELGGGDALRVNDTALAYSDLLIPHYEGTLMPAESYSFVLTRPGEEPYTSTVSAPTALTITSPAPDDELSRSADFTVTWDDPASTGVYFTSVGVFAQGCGIFVGEFVMDATTFTFAASDFMEPTEDGEGMQSVCDGETLAAELSVESALSGTLAEGLDGAISSHARTLINVTLTP